METIIAAADFFATKLSYETDPTDLAAIRAAGAGPVVIDTRSLAGWVQGRIPGAIQWGDPVTCRVPPCFGVRAGVLAFLAGAGFVPSRGR